MPLISLLKSDPDTVEKFTIQQAVAFAGDGKLKDGSECSAELRQYLAQASSRQLQMYIEQCLTDSFEKSGQVLQDIVNELGRRLEYRVENGLYAGRSNAIGNDGLWQAPEGNHVVVEVKTSDAYRLSLDVIAGYRKSLQANGRITGDSSILIVVGRQSTGELEAQVRGSRHAWDVRIISAEALMKLVLLKENSDEEETGRKIRSVIVPVEYTRVDALVDVVFAAATDTEEETLLLEETSAKEVAPEKNTARTPSDRADLNAKREQIIRAMSEKLGDRLIKKSRAMFWSSDHSMRVACTISKRYDAGHDYWYAFHPKWQSFLDEGKDAYFVLGCADLNRAFALPVDWLKALLPDLNITQTDRHMYWHIHLNTDAEGRVTLKVPRRPSLDLEPYAVELLSALPAEAVEHPAHRPATMEEVVESLTRRREVNQPVLDYLRDK